MNSMLIERLLVDLVAPHCAGSDLEDRLASLSPDQWRALHRRAQDHRLIPYLHFSAIEQAALPIPAAYAARWREEARAATIVSLLNQRDLMTSIAILREVDIEPIALKGAALAYTAYPQPGLRPMRDLDLWVDKERALEAHALLVDNGYRPLTSGDPETLLERHHQLPLLLSPTGDTQVELHLRLFHHEVAEDPSLRADFVSASKSIDMAGFPVRVPSNEHLLLHMVVHAAYDHRFDNGPLTLPDIAWLTKTAAIDWAAYHDLTGDFRRGSDLLLGVTRRRWPDAPIEGIDPASDDDERMILPLIAQDGQARQGAREFAAPGLGPTAFPSRHRMAELYGGYARLIWPLSWIAHWWRLLTQRLPALITAKGSQETHFLAAHDAQYREWLGQKS